MAGFIKPVAGVTRMRFVRPGLDPDDYTLPQNLVIFDSAVAGAASVFVSGSVAITTANPGQVISWPDLAYTPHVTVLIDFSGSVFNLAIVSSSSPLPDIYATPTGIHATGFNAFSLPVNIVYVVWRVPA